MDQETSTKLLEPALYPNFSEIPEKLVRNREVNLTKPQKLEKTVKTKKSGTNILVLDCPMD